MYNSEMVVTGGRGVEEKVLDEGIHHRFAKLADLGEVLKQSLDPDVEAFVRQASPRGESEGASGAGIHDDDVVISSCIMHG